MKKYTKEEVVELFDEYRLKNLAVSGYINYNAFLKSKGLIEQFEAGWYKNQYGLVYFNEDKDGLYGFDYGRWVAEKCYFDESNITKATDKEVGEALIKEAKRRGFKKGVRVVNGGLGEITNEKSICLGFGTSEIGKYNYLWMDVLNGYHVLIFDNGKWAEIVEETKELTIEEIQEKLGYKIKIVE